MYVFKIAFKFSMDAFGKNAKIINSQPSNRQFEKLRDTLKSDGRHSVCFWPYDGI
jgi:hypothetical protein